MKDKLCASHEIEYLLDKAHKPPEEVQDVLGDEFTFCQIESNGLFYAWVFKATVDLSEVWIDFKLYGSLGETRRKSKGEKKLLISKSKRKYTYECGDT